MLLLLLLLPPLAPPAIVLASNQTDQPPPPLFFRFLLLVHQGRRGRSSRGSPRRGGIDLSLGAMGKIQYAVVARGAVVLAEHGGAWAATTNAGPVARQILERLHAGGGGGADCHVSYTQGLYVFHAKRTDGVTVLCMTDDAAGRRIPFAFLEDIHGRFVKTYGRAALTALAYAMNNEFSRVLSQRMDYYSNDPNADSINRMKGEMDQLRSVMIDNIDKVLERSDRLELLVDKTATMQGNTMRFKRQARRFRNTVWWRNVKLTAALIFILLVIIYIVLVYMCHGFTLPSCVR